MSDVLVYSDLGGEGSWWFRLVQEAYEYGYYTTEDIEDAIVDIERLTKKPAQWT